MLHLYPHKQARGRRHNGFTAPRARRSFKDGRPFYTADGYKYTRFDLEPGDTVKFHLKDGVTLTSRVRDLAPTD